FRSRAHPAAAGAGTRRALRPGRPAPGGGVALHQEVAARRAVRRAARALVRGARDAARRPATPRLRPRGEVRAPGARPGCGVRGAGLGARPRRRGPRRHGARRRQRPLPARLGPVVAHPRPVAASRVPRAGGQVRGTRPRVRVHDDRPRRRRPVPAAAGRGPGMSRVCYQVHSHHLPGQVERLVRGLVDAGTDAVVLVNHDERGPELPRALDRLDGVHVLRARGGYGDLSHVDRWMAAVRWLEAHGVDYDWMVTLSGQDYPLRPIGQLEKELAESGADGFLEHFAAFSADCPWPTRRVRTRYYFRHARLPALPRPARRLMRLASGLNLLQPAVRVNAAFGSVGVRTPTPYGPGFALWGGSFFTSLRRPCVDHLYAFYRTKPAVMRYFRGTLAPEEVFFQTVLVAADRFRLVNDPLRYFDFAH